MSYKILLGLTALSSALILSCSRDPAPARDNPTDASVDRRVNYGELALLGLAHKTFGENSTYRNERISDLNGDIKICGEFANFDEPYTYRRYTFSRDHYRIFSDNENSAWEERCDVGWEVGSGRVVE